jgi:NAD(P) transhydrogenase
MTTEEYDMVVLGSGPGGEGAAIQAAKLRKKVAVVERFNEVGGGCTHWGTIPSKALRYAIFRMIDTNENPLFRDAGVSIHLEFPQLRRAAVNVIEQQVSLRRSFYERNEVAVVRGRARFVDANTVEALEEDGGRRVLHAKSFVIATGARPFRPADIDFSHPNIRDSDTILNLAGTPKSISVYGAGVIGCEYASMFKNMGCKVNLINTRDRLLEFLDDEISDALGYHLRDRGILIRHRESYERIEGTADGVILHTKSGKQIHTDLLLFANGRSGNSDNLGLEAIGVTPDPRGNIPVNDNFQTALTHIYAVGDVIGPPALASAAYVQGRSAALHCLTGTFERAMVRDIPSGIYTSPEISSLGKTERQLTEEKIPYEIGHAAFKNLARAHITGRTVGMLKLLFHRETLEILGIHSFGAQSSEIIHIGQAIMAQAPPANSLLYFINTTFNYPTMAEAYRVAALNGFNRLQ